jgi:V/A-type H+/Na+-transporting ATPase subunit I
MIEKMKKITVLLHNSEKKKTLAKLQELGLLHLDTDNSNIGDKLRKLQKKMQTYESILQKVEKLGNMYLDELKSFDNNESIFSSKESDFFPSKIATFHQKMLHLEEMFAKLENEYSAREEMKRDSMAIHPWGDFDWEKIDYLNESGIDTKFHITTIATWNKTKLPDPYFFPIHREGEDLYLVHFIPKFSYSETKQDIEESSEESKDPGFDEIQLPRTSITEIQKDIAILERSIKKDELFLAQFSQEKELIQYEIDKIQVAIDFEMAKLSLANDKNATVFSISGYLPLLEEKKILTFLKEESISYQIDKPKLGEDVPIKLRNNWFSKAFEPITRIFALPKYMELDPTVFFAPFFTLFFGLCLGDIGYGAILLLLSVIAYTKLSKDKKVIALLMIYLSVSTIFSGFLLNTFFGEAFFKMPGSDFYILENGGSIALFSAYTIDGKTIYPAMTLALVLGFIQLSFALFLQAVNQFKLERNFLYSIKPLSVLALIWGGTIVAVHRDFLDLGFNKDFAVGIFPIGQWLIGFPLLLGQSVFYLGVIFFFLFNNPDKKFFIRPVFGIWEAYQFVIGFSGDFLSYVRLFALGLASGLLGNAFNQVAFMVLPNGDMASPFVVFTLIIMVLGHVLNIALSVLGSFVHPLRLTFVEFYKNMNFVGGGREFKPFTVAKENSF